MRCRRFAALWAILAFFTLNSPGQVVITEIMYHPVEEPAFNQDGSPVLDLSEDVHEFVELHNAGNESVVLTGWRLAGGIAYAFPTNAIIAPGEFLVVAKQPGQLRNVAAYRLSTATVLGPYDGQLGNDNDTIRLRDASDQTVDAVSYSARFPWAIGADALGADDEWTGLKSSDYQYRGRSLERVSFTHPANDPANWLASPVGGDPSPGKANAVSRSVPLPIVSQFTVSQTNADSSAIRSGQPVRLWCQFSSAAGLAKVNVEWFVDDIESTGEPTVLTPLAPEGAASTAQFSASLPSQIDRSIVRFRIRADRGGGDEVVSPRADDPFGWHAYFVTPVRSSPRPIYDCFISSNSLRVLRTNISQNPRRVSRPDPPGQPRASWNATEPAIMVYDGVVYDIRMRHHGSRYNRSADRNSFKWHFPRYQKFNGVTAVFETDKGNDFIVGHGLFRAIGLPVSAVRYVDLYLNTRSAMQRLEQGEFDGAMLDEYHRTQRALNPGSALEPSGEIYKSVGTIDLPGEGPYGRGDGRQLSKPPSWTDLQMYEWTYSLQNHGWRGSFSWKQMIDAFWAARGDSPDQPNPNIPALRRFFTEHFDVDEMLTYIAVENWCCPWDDTTQNHFFWQRHNGKWGMLPWDNDAWYGRGDNTPATSSLFIGEVDDPNNNFRGPNFFKDAFIKAFREELKQRFFLLNNTFLHPDNLTALGFGSIRSFATARMASVNEQCGFGPFQRPNKPADLSPSAGAATFPPAQLRAGTYTHSAAPARAHSQTIWEIRTAAGSYQAPVWKLASSTNLTSVPLPFEQLKFAQTYYWRCTYIDVDGHPSIPSDEASFNFGPASANNALVAIDAATQWRYDQSGTDLSDAGWTSLDYNDSQWSSGPALLAREEAALPEPIRTELTLGRNTYYFRKRFNLPGPTQGASVRLRATIDDGCVIYINGIEWLRIRMPDGPVTYDTAANANVGDAVTEGPFDVPSSMLRSGDNVIAVEVHQSNLNSSDVVFGIALDATLPAGTGSVVLNEVAAASSNQAPVTPDWIELYNNGTQSVDLGGFALSDDVLRPNRFVFPSNTPLAPKGYLVVWCDDNGGSPGLHSGFRLDAQGQTVTLYQLVGGSLQVADFVSYGLQIPDRTVGRVPDGAGNWHLTISTLGNANQTADLALPSGLRINEWMAAPETGDDWFELFNPATLPVELSGLSLTDDSNNPTNTSIPSLSFIGPGRFTQFIADQKVEKGANHVGFRLSADGETLALYAADGVTVIDLVRFGPQQPGVSEGRLPDGSDSITSFPSAASPGQSNHPVLPNRWQLSIAQGPGGQLAIKVDGTGTGQLFLSTSADLSSWTPVAIRAAADGSFTFMDTIGASARYYRVAVEP